VVVAGAPCRQEAGGRSETRFGTPDVTVASAEGMEAIGGPGNQMLNRSSVGDRKEIQDVIVSDFERVQNTLRNADRVSTANKSRPSSHRKASGGLTEEK
jgi:hypothetical protein